MKTVKYGFHIKGNFSDVAYRETVEVDHKDDATKEEMEEDVRQAYEKWRDSLFIGHWTKFELIS